MSEPTLADVLKCKIVSSELTSKFHEGEAIRVPAGEITRLLWFKPSKVELHVWTTGEDDKKVTVSDGLYNFLMDLAEQGPEVEKEIKGTVWKFARV